MSIKQVSMLLEIENARKAKKADDEGIDDGAGSNDGDMDEEELSDDMLEEDEDLSEEEEEME